MRTLGTITAALGTVLLLALLYGTAVEPRLILDVEEHVAPIPNLPASWEGRTVAVLGDFQIGMWLDNDGMAARAVRVAVARRPAAVLLTGDFIYGPGADPARLVAGAAALLRPLARSGIPTFAVLGNHDRGIARPGRPPDPRAVRLLRDMLDSLGIVLLHNRAVALAAGAGGEPLYVIGLGSRYAGEDHVPRAFDGVPEDAARIAVMHHPDTFARIPAGAAPLAVAGHTHGGQVRLPFSPEWSWLRFIQGDEVHADGWIDGYGTEGNRLYVNRGIGMSLLPVRVNCPPEVTFMTLRRGRVRPDGGGREG